MKSVAAVFKIFFTTKIFIILLFLVMLLLRLVYLDADPSFVKRVSDLSDEGIWVHGARSLFLFDDPSPDQANQSWSVTILHTLLMVLSFSFFGVGLYQARLVSALSGWFILLILYFFIKRQWGEKPALVSVLILGLNDTFLIYNKLAFGVVLPEMFILLAFFLWYKGAKNKVFYLLSGISFALAILSKLSAYYFALVFLILWLLQLYRKETQISAIFWFGIGSLILLIPYAIFLTINWDVLSVNFMVLYNFYNSDGSIILNFFRSFSNNLFGLPSMFLLIVLTALYFLKRNRFLDLREMDFVELTALCWLVVGFVSIVLLSDLSDRRFYGFLIPMSILSAKLYLENGAIDLNTIISKVKENCLKGFLERGIYSLLFSYPLVALLVSSGSLYLCNPIGKCRIFQWYFLLIFLVIFILFLAALTFLKRKFKEYFVHFFTVSSICLLALLPFFTLLRHFSRHFGIITSTLDQETIYIIASASFVLVMMAAYAFLSIRCRNLLFLKPTLIKGFLMFYFIISGGLIGLTFIKPSFTLSDSSRDLIILGKSEASGALDQVLSINSFYLPLLITGGVFEPVNKEHDKNRIHTIFKMQSMDGRPQEGGARLSEKEYTHSTLIRTIYLFPYPFTDKYRVVIKVYEVEGYNKENE